MKFSLLVVIFYSVIEFACASSFLPKQFEANLEQQIERVAAKKKSIDKSNVLMKYMFPNHIYFNVADADTPVLYICNKSKTWLYNPPFVEGEKGEVIVGSSSKHCHVKIFDALSNGLKNNNIYNVKTRGKVAKLSFSKKAQTQLAIDTIELVFKNTISAQTTISDISQMSVFKLGQKKPTVFIFKSLLINQKIKKSDFIFKIPENTNIKNI